MEGLIHFIEVVGYFGYGILFLVIFLESFPPTFFFPGDSLLFTTGFLASQGHFSIFILLPVFFVASICGYIFSYAMGKKIRDIILNSNDRYWFKKKHLVYTEEFYNKYGSKTVVIGRFIPVVRSFAPTLAGAVSMEKSRFVRYAVLGGLLWTGGITMLGFYLGNLIPEAHLYLAPIIVAIIFVSLLPAIIEVVYKKIKQRKESVISE